jgi:DNA polymerase I-like protein with 3'-5' exonuclease and polymerase domains
MYVGPYAEQDAALTLKLWGALKTKIIQDDLLDVFKLESDLFPVLFEMKKQGVRIDLDKAEATKKDLYKQEQGILKKIHDISGMHVDIWAAASVAKAFDAQGIEYDKTEKTKQAKLDKEFLVSHPSDLARLVVRAREINKARTTFIDSILKHSHRGRIFAEVNQMRNEQGGTISGRLSMQNPNLQQIPARDEEIGPLIRSLFIPEEGTTWGCFDYSQQEPRLLVHYASVLKQEGSETLVNGYREGDIDFHQTVADMAGIDRKQAKTINLGMMYGMGKGKLGSQLGLDKEDVDDIFKQYHSTVPFVKVLTEGTMGRAQKMGFIRTILGRKCRFDLWEPSSYGIHKPLSFKDAEAEYGGINRIRRACTVQRYKINLTSDTESNRENQLCRKTASPSAFG